MYFEVLLLGAHIFTLLLLLMNFPLYHYEMSITSNIPCSEIYQCDIKYNNLTFPFFTVCMVYFFHPFTFNLYVPSHLKCFL